MADRLTGNYDFDGTGVKLKNVSEHLFYQEATGDVTIDWANGDVQYIYVNPAGESIQITLPADPGPIGKAGMLLVKNNTGKAHTWATSPAIRFISSADADTAPLQRQSVITRSIQQCGMTTTEEWVIGW